MAERRREFTVAEAALLAEDALGVAVPHARVRRWIHLGRIQRNACGKVDGHSLLVYLEARTGEVAETRQAQQ